MNTISTHGCSAQASPIASSRWAKTTGERGIEQEVPSAEPTNVNRDLAIGDLRAALSAGWRDFCAHPVFGLFSSSIFVLAGLCISYLLLLHGEAVWLIPAAAGFPILAPFTAVGLYEVSRRHELGIPIGWGSILGALNGRGDQQILSMGVIIFVAFSFWVIIAHAAFSIFLVTTGASAESLEIFLTLEGALFLIIGSAIGGIMALAFYAMTVMSLPMLVDRKVDFVTAIITSLRAFNQNKLVLLVWAFAIAASLFLALIPLMVGLFVALPVLGHATWHLYRRTCPEHTQSTVRQ